MKNDGKHFESLTAQFLRIYEGGHLKVEQDVQLPGADGPRQFDVVMRDRTGPFPILTAVECRDYNKKIDVTALDAFDSKLRDVGATKGVMVNRRGYSGTAAKKAKRLGIGLYTLNDGPERLKSLGLQVPVVVKEVKAARIQTRFDVRVGGRGKAMMYPMQVSGRDVSEYVRELVLRRAAEIEGDAFMQIIPEDLKPWTCRVGDTTKSCRNVAIEFYVSVAYYFGYLEDSPSTVALRDEIEGDRGTLAFRKEELFEYAKTFARYERAADLPRPPLLSLVSAPPSEWASGDVELTDSAGRKQRVQSTFDPPRRSGPNRGQRPK